jgi:predicted amidophosphoribosyltransferase
MDARGPVANALLDALAVLLPVECAGCGVPDRSTCSGCLAALAASGRPGRVALRPPGSAQTGADVLPVCFAIDYAGVAKDMLHALKEQGRVDAARPLGRMLGRAMSEAVRQARRDIPAGSRVELLAVPSSRRALRLRGYNPVETLLRWAGPQPSRASGIRYRRAPHDQASLGAEQRWSNLAGSIEADARRLRGRHLLLVDDVVTTGATLLECRRAVEAVGGHLWGGIALAHTAKVKGTNSELHGDLARWQVYGGGKGAESNRPRLGRRVLD